MKNQIVARDFYKSIKHKHELPDINKPIFNGITHKIKNQDLIKDSQNEHAEILFITSYPPRECGIATYSQDLIKALNNKFSNSLSIKVCALETGNTEYQYPQEVKYILNTSVAEEYEKLAFNINKDDRIQIVLIQHEFGFFRSEEHT